MRLIKEIEEQAQKLIQSIKVDSQSEVAWLKRLVEEHPVFQGVPEEVKKQQIEPAC